jgi:uncharacterized protein YndB with AHSA1/START domain
MNETTTSVFTVLIKGSIDKVWHEITQRERPQACMFNSRLDTEGLRPGAQIRMRTPSGRYTGVVGEVLEFDPPRRYAHTFRFTNLDDAECVVQYDLKEVPDGVEFTMTLRDMPKGSKTEKQMVQGMKLIMNTLKSVVETGRPSFGTRMLLGFIGMMEPFSPKACKSEYWPLNKRVSECGLQSTRIKS